MYVHSNTERKWLRRGLRDSVPLKGKYLSKRNVCAGCGTLGDKSEKHKISWFPLTNLIIRIQSRTRIFVTAFTKSPVHYPVNRVHTRSSFKNHFNIIRPFLAGLPGDVFVWWRLRITKVARRHKYFSDLIFLFSQSAAACNTWLKTVHSSYSVWESERTHTFRA